ncbi:MAG: biotin synthase BioB [Gammaproteobacteria bacterium]|nr:biotin synthase BioB [Gammaproteobacteria bacterium]
MQVLKSVDDVLRHDWAVEEIEALFELPFNDLLYQAHVVHRQNFDVNEIQMSALLSIKTGACPEDCSYCPQSAHHHKDTELEVERLMVVDKVLEAARQAKDNGASRFCMGAAWRNPKEKDFVQVLAMVEGVKALGMEACATLGMLDADQAQRLQDVGLDYYNHNLDTSPEFYGEVITTRTYQDRLDTLEHVRDAGMRVCAGGIIGMGEGRKDRAGLLQALANMERHPESVPINNLVQVEGTPLVGVDKTDPLEFIRMIAVARILMPRSHVRLSAGRHEMSDEMQAMCFFAGANSIFYGERLLTTDNAAATDDRALLDRLGMRVQQGSAVVSPAAEGDFWGKACTDHSH